MANVLVVEDDTDARKLIRHRLQQLGHAIAEAASGESAL